MVQNTATKKNNAYDSKDSKNQAPQKLGLQTIKLANLDVTKMTYSKPDMENEKSGAQGIGFVKYQVSPTAECSFAFPTGAIKLVQGGVPSLHEQYYPTDDKRAFVNIPLDPNQPSSVELFNRLSQWDAYVLKHQASILKGLPANKYTYSPLVRVPEEEDDDDNTVKKSKKSPKMTKCKAKLAVDFGTQTVSTSIFVLENGQPQPYDAKTVSDVASVVTWNSTCRFILAPSKLWVDKTTKKVAGVSVKSFGIALKCLQICVTEKSTTGESAATVFKQYAFGGDEENETNEVEVEVEAEAEVEEAEEEEAEEAEEEEEEVEEEEEEEEEPEPVKVPVKRAGGKKK